ncbi:hypothetical protein G3I71_17875 [Streptomyces sp. SID12501]|uniref:Uncharacterized protein n=1 Tax=Streptomyces sp. SID12501 TaxID=2706042 RepID=A0A6B3BTH2_9ACTN|nr:hypothetical protein [Streptomyces sp. SID12501]
MNAVDTPERALVWMRLAVRVLLAAFDPERAFRCLDHDQWEAVMRLRAGEPYAFVASSGARVSSRCTSLTSVWP